MELFINLCFLFQVSPLTCLNINLIMVRCPTVDRFMKHAWGNSLQYYSLFIRHTMESSVNVLICSFCSLLIPWDFQDPSLIYLLKYSEHNIGVGDRQQLSWRSSMNVVHDPPNNGSPPVNVLGSSHAVCVLCVPASVRSAHSYTFRRAYKTVSVISVSTKHRIMAS